MACQVNRTVQLLSLSAVEESHDFVVHIAITAAVVPEELTVLRGRVSVRRDRHGDHHGGYVLLLLAHQR